MDKTQHVNVKRLAKDVAERSKSPEEKAGNFAGWGCAAFVILMALLVLVICAGLVTKLAIWSWS